MNKETCENCKYWLGDLDDDQRICKRFPPVYIFTPEDMDSEDGHYLQSFAWSQPSVSFDSWCGEWKAIA
jgi:hypothetical protein